MDDKVIHTPNTLRLSRRDALKMSAALLAGFRLENDPAQSAVPKRIYIALDDHTDYFWTADEADYEQAFIEMLDFYLDLADRTEENPPDFQSRWNCDGSRWLWVYEKNKSPEAFARLIERIRDGHISAPLNALVVCQGGAPTEAVLRGMYYAGKLERRYDLRFLMAIAMENQTLPYGLGALWAGAGAKYSWKGICNCDTRLIDAGNREHEIYWWAGPDGSRILMKWNSLAADARHIGGYAEARYPDEIVEYVDHDPNFGAVYPYSVIGVFGKGWDDFKTLTDEFPVIAREKSNADRRVIVSNEEDFFDDFVSTYGADIPSVSASFGNEWDLYCAALAEVSASVKRSTEKLRGAEALATLVTLIDTTFMEGRSEERDRAWMDLGLFWEHNWGVVGRFDEFGEARIGWQRRLASEIATYVDQLQTDAISTLGTLIPLAGDHLRFFVFNPLNWIRTDFADFPTNTDDPVHVIDLQTGEEVPSQRITTLSGGPCLRIMAGNVPSMGYKVFEIRPGQGKAFSDAAVTSDNGATFEIENNYYHITVADRGAIISLIDKGREDREFARHSGERYINDLGESASGVLSIENVGPVSVTVLAVSSDPLAHISRITLFRDHNRIEICNEITENFDDEFTWSFGFEVDDPDIWHEEVGAIIRAKLVADGGHYASRSARYDWLTLNHFADISGSDETGVTLSNADCCFMRIGNSQPEELNLNRSQISVLAGGRVVKATRGSGIPDQGGDTYFLQRFALQTRDRFDPVQAMRFALEHQNPFITGRVTGESSVYPAQHYSLVHISDPNIILWALKPADDTSDLIARLWNLDSSETSFTLACSGYTVTGAHHATHIETVLEAAHIEEGALVENINGQQLKTFTIALAPTGDFSDA